MQWLLSRCGDPSLGASFDPVGAPDERVDRISDMVTDGDLALATLPFIIEDSLEREVGTATVAEGTARPQAADVPGATPVSKAAFILALPVHFSAKEAAAEAKQKGLAISDKYVYQVRAAAKEKSKPANTPKAAAAKLASTGAAKAAMEGKVEFLRSLPPEMSYAEAAGKAIDVGISLTVAQFYRFKSQASTGRVPRAASRKPVPRAPSSKPVREPTPELAPTPSFKGLRVASDDEREQALIDAIRALGLQRARTVIDAVEKFEGVVTPP